MAADIWANNNREAGMTPAERAKAKKLFAMLQSPYESEVLIATRKLKELLAEHGMTINDLVAGNVDWDAPTRDNQAGTQTQSPPPPPSGPPPPPRPPDRHIDLVANYLAGEFQAQYDIDLHDNAIAMGQLKQAAENAIMNLLSATATRIDLPYIAHGKDGTPLALTHWLTQQEFQLWLTNPPPPHQTPPPHQAAHTWQPYQQGQQWTTADKVAIGLVVLFFIGLPALGGLLALYDKAPDPVVVPANKVGPDELPPEKPKPEQITLNDLVFSGVVLPNQTGDGGIKGVINNNSNLSLERITFEAVLKDGDQLISTITAQICSSYWYSQPKHSGCYGLCDRETLPVPPHQVRQLSTCDLGFGQIPQLKNPRIGYKVTQINENDVQMETLFAKTPAEIAAEADVR
jgi:hypothetical protein